MGEAKGKATAKAKGTKGHNADASDGVDPNTSEKKAMAKASALKHKQFITVAEAAVLREAMNNDEGYKHLASDHNKAQLEEADQTLKSAMNTRSPSGKLWRAWVERKLQELKTNMHPEEFTHELLEFPKMLQKPLDKLEGTVEVFKEVHTNMLQAEKKA